ncbi:PEPxxWA-CTERM sorting domain-containing protein [Sphingomonas bacterium]|uniref:PEPxxWA-CTERM sorting domain-containing protein n=1 Tax=Sphingomonas bacterium TaxID=1895847 RepID=UPI0015756344|nr:PEPxxWA-CTERM sorting domain-containing protein [Sphingomonas bacterium]
MRRHLLMNVGLVASCVVGGTVVTNERGLFVPLGIHGMSETAKAFAAMFTPSTLLPGLTNVQMVAPLEPFDVTADSRDLRRRLMDAFADFSAPAADYNQEVAQFSSQTLSPTELASNAGPLGGVAPAGVAGAAGSDGAGAAVSDSGAVVAAGSDAASGSTATAGGTSATKTADTASTGAASPLAKSTGDLLASNAATSNSEVNATPPTVDTPTPVEPPVVVSPVTPPATTPVPEPSVWAMLLGGFGAIGYLQRSARRRRRAEAEAAA